jgi:hypothetical protein
MASFFVRCGQVFRSPAYKREKGLLSAEEEAALFPEVRHPFPFSGVAEPIFRSHREKLQLHPGQSFRRFNFKRTWFRESSARHRLVSTSTRPSPSLLFSCLQGDAVNAFKSGESEGYFADEDDEDDVKPSTAFASIYESNIPQLAEVRVDAQIG